MKAPVGLLSGSAVCDSRWRGVAPTSATPTRALRKLTRVEEVKSRMDKKFSRIENLWPRGDASSSEVINEQRQDIIMAMVPCLLCYMAHWGQSLRTCVRDVGTHVRSKMAKFSYIGVFFHWQIWYTRLSPVNRNLRRKSR